jgi:hypothetical protein
MIGPCVAPIRVADNKGTFICSARHRNYETGSSSVAGSSVAKRWTDRAI